MPSLSGADAMSEAWFAAAWRGRRPRHVVCVDLDPGFALALSANIRTWRRSYPGPPEGMRDRLRADAVFNVLVQASERRTAATRKKG